jgi:hypothetical protein
MTIKMKLQKITPATAKKWEGSQRNRKTSRAGVRKLVRAIRANEWRETGDAIKISTRGVLVDGGHRCRAIVESGQSITSWVAYDVPHTSQVYDTFNLGKTGNVADMLSRDGYSYPFEMASAIRWVMALLHGYQHARENNRPRVAREILRKHPGIEDSLAFVLELRGKDLWSAGVLAALHYMCSSKSKSDADLFWSRVIAGEKIDRTMPEYALRRLLLQRRLQGTGFRDIATGVALCIKAWNNRRQGTSVRLKSKKGEAIPVIK